MTVDSRHPWQAERIGFVECEVCQYTTLAGRLATSVIGNRPFIKAQAASVRMATDIVGQYSLVSSDKFDDYLKAVGVSWPLRKLATLVESATIDITKDGDEYTMKTTTNVKSSAVKFKLNEEFTEKTMDGRDVQTTFLMEGNKLKQVQRDPKTNQQTSVDRVFAGDELTTTMHAGEVTCTRKYKKV